MSKGTGLVDLELQMHAETKLAIKVSDDGDPKYAVWLPKSAIEFEHRERGNSAALVLVTLPELLAIEKGLL